MTGGEICQFRRSPADTMTPNLSRSADEERPDQYIPDLEARFRGDDGCSSMGGDAIVDRGGDP